MTVQRNDNGYAEIEGKSGIHCWSQYDPNIWKLVDNGYTIAEIRFNTTRERKTDYTGRRQYRIQTTHHLTFSIRLEHAQDDYTLDDCGYTFYGGEAETIRKVMEMYQNGWFWQEITWDAEGKARDAGASELAIMNARYDTSWMNRNDDQHVAQRMARLARKAD
ncbi:MAG: hypothetical protein KJ604_20465 [Gammaproteobacteria bacterium]|nr:hypothetical protein [Gammaproteobacteria bacterium]